MVTVERIGVGIGEDAVRGVGLRAGAIVWAAAIPLQDAASLQAAIGSLLREAPRGRWRAPPVEVAIGPALAQLRRLPGLPAIVDPKIVAGLIRTNPGAFFLAGLGPQSPASPVCGAEGSWWSAVADATTLDAIEVGVRAAGCRLRCVRPTMALLPGCLGLEEAWWQDDGEIVTRVRVRGDRLAAIDRLPEAPPMDQPLTPALEPLGEDGARFLDAYAALSESDVAAPVWLPVSGTAAGTVPRWRAALAALALLTSASVLTLRPGLTTWMAARTAQVALDSLGPLAAPAQTAERELVRFHEALAEFELLGVSGGIAPIPVLAGLTVTLPERSAITSLRLDSVALQLVILAPRIATIVDRLDTVPYLTDPRIVGPIARESIAGQAVERATLRAILP